jgi:hypothetical protein
MNACNFDYDRGFCSAWTSARRCLHSLYKARAPEWRGHQLLKLLKLPGFDGDQRFVRLSSERGSHAWIFLHVESEPTLHRPGNQYPLWDPVELKYTEVKFIPDLASSTTFRRLRIRKGGKRLAWECRGTVDFTAWYSAGLTLSWRTPTIAIPIRVARWTSIKPRKAHRNRSASKTVTRILMDDELDI